MSINVLPEGCIAEIISLTSPLDACRVSLVSSTFQSASCWDNVWERFLPSDYRSIIARSVSDLPEFTTKKDLYFWLCHNPIIIDNGIKSFALEKRSGKKCFMLAARDLSIIWGDTSAYWKWPSSIDSRFGEVAELFNVCWLQICGKINVSMLSPDTSYAAYLVFKMSPDAYGFDHPPVNISVGFVGSESSTKTVCLNPSYRRGRLRTMRALWGTRYRSMVGLESPKERGDGWLEIELGVFFNDGGTDDEFEMSIKEVDGGHWKRGLIVEGIEIRPKQV